MRRQLPVYSPLSAGAIALATLAALRDGDGERAALAHELRGRFDAEQVILTASGTQALQLALSSLPITANQGVVVALPGFSCYDLVAAAIGAGVRVRFYDIDPITLTPDVESVRDVLRAGVSALVAANLYGYPLNWGDLRTECEAAGVVLIEDAAQGIGTVSDEGPGGTLGVATVLSFGRGKGWTGGGGGALLLRGAALGRVTDAIEADATESAGLRPPTVTPPQRGGWGAKGFLTTGAAWALGRPTLYAIPTSIPGLGLGETHYHHPTEPRAISAFSAALTRRTSEASSAAVPERREKAGRWVRELQTSSHHQGTDRHRRIYACRPWTVPDSATFLRLPLVFPSPALAAVFAASRRDRGVAGGYPIALHRLPQSAALQIVEPPRLAGSELLASSLVTLPTHGWVTHRDEEAVAVGLRSASSEAD